MSWSHEGRYYHVWAEYQAATQRTLEREIRGRVERLRATPIDTSQLEASAASAVAAQRRTRAAIRDVEAELVSLKHDTESFPREHASMVEKAQDGLRALATELEKIRIENDQKIKTGEEERRTRAEAIRAALGREQVADAERADAKSLRAAKLLLQAKERLDSIDLGRAKELGLPIEMVQGMIETARETDGSRDIGPAREAFDLAADLVSELEWRSALVDQGKAGLKEDIAALAGELNFDEQQRDLVGRGERALDAPMREALRLAAVSVDGLRGYDSFEVRLEEIERDLAPVRSQVRRLASMVMEYDALEAGRTKQMATVLAELKKIYGELQCSEHSDDDETVPQLAPIRGVWKSGQGNTIECQFDLDGTVRIHDAHHRNLAECHESLAKFTQAAPEFMAFLRAPRMDAAEAAEREQAQATHPGAMRDRAVNRDGR